MAVGFGAVNRWLVGFQFGIIGLLMPILLKML